MARQSDIRLRRSAVAGAIPSAANLNLGELALNTADGKMYMKKSLGGTDTVVEIGGGTTQDGVWNEYKYTSTNNQTTYTGTDDDGKTLSYLVGYLQVFFNGILLDNGIDYAASNSSSIVLTNAASTSDIVQISSFAKVLGTGDVTRSTLSGNGSTTAFTIASAPTHENNLQVFIDGVYQEKSTYSLSNTTLTFSTAPTNGTTIEVMIGTNNVTVDGVQDLAIGGNLTVAGTSIFSASMTGNLTGNASGSAGTATSLSNHNTGALTEGSNLYFTNERVDDRVNALIVGGTGITATYNDSAGTLTIDGSAQYGDSDVESYLSGGTGVTFSSGAISIGQAVATTDNVTFAVITATGGTSTQWNTAHGWGNHGAQSYATQTYVNTQVSNLVDSAPGALDTLNELAAAIGDDANFSTTITNSIAAKLPLAGGTLTGTLNGTTASFSNTVTATNGFLGNITGNVTGNVSGSAGTVTSLSSHDTGDLSEGSNLYYTNARADARADVRIAASNTGDLSEGSNLYFTNERVDDRVGALVQAGTNITVSYNDAAGTLTINSSGKTQEEIEDIVDGLLVAGTGIGLTYDDAAGTLTVANTAVGANAFGNIVISGQTTVAADSTNDTLTLVGGTGIVLTSNAGSDTVTITNSSLGANAFGSIAVGGQTTVAADSTGDTLTLVGTHGVTITTDAGSDTVTIDGHTSYSPFTTDLFTGNNSTTVFVLSAIPTSEDNLMVFIEGVYQNKNSYSLSGSTLTMDGAPGTGEELVVHQAGAIVTGVGLIKNNFTGDGSTTAFTLSIDAMHENNVFVYSDGVYQEKVEFSISGTTLTFVTAPLTGASLEIILPQATELQTPSANSVNAVTQFNEDNIVPNLVTATTFATTSATTIASHAAATYRTVKYLVQCTQGTDYHSTEINIIHDGTTVYLTEYGSLWDNAALGTFDAVISGANIILQITAGSASSMTTKVISTAIPL